MEISVANGFRAAGSGNWFLRPWTIGKFCILMVFLMLSVDYGATAGDLNYVFFGILLAGVFVRAALLRTFPRLRLGRADLLPIILVLLWFYGFILGFLNGNPTTGVIRNFAGMVLFVTYYLLIAFNIPKSWVYSTVLLASWVNLASFLFNAFLAIRSNGLGIALVLEGVGKQRLFYSGGVIVIYALISTLIAVLLVPRAQAVKDFLNLTKLIPKSQGLRVVALALALFGIMITFSKGFILGFLFLAVALPAALFGRSLVRCKVSSGVLTVLLLLGSITGVGFYFGVNELVGQTFAAQEVSNETRYEQTNELMRDLTVFGKGLGAGLAGGYSRDELGYGFEVSFVNIFHKFGVFALLLLYGYASLLFRLLRNLYRGELLAYSALGLGAMCYLFPSIGNPMLLGTVPNLLFCCSLYLLREPPGAQRGSSGVKNEVGICKTARTGVGSSAG